MQSLAPVYEQVADAFAHAKDKIIIAKVDADGVGKSLGHRFGVKGYPSPSSRFDNSTLLIIHRNSFEMVLR